jgi:hypothetical protein
MDNSFLAVRSRIHQKSHDYFVFSHGRWDREKRNMFYGATDTLADASHAAGDYEKAISPNAGSNLLVCYGFLQALYVQQDAVMTLSRAVDLNWHPNNNERLKQIRDVRNRLTGHPALAGERDNPRRISSANIAYDDITELGFRGHVYYEDGFENIDVDVPAFRKDNEELLSLQMQQVEQKMDEQEREFRDRESKHLLLPRFGNPFSYLMQRLSCDLADEGRLVQAQFHAQEIRKIIADFRDELGARGFSSEGIAYHIRLVLTGLNRLEAFMRDECPTQDTQDEFDLVYDGIEKNVNQIRNFAAEIDENLCTPIHRGATTD